MRRQSALWAFFLGTFLKRRELLVSCSRQYGLCSIAKLPHCLCRRSRFTCLQVTGCCPPCNRPSTRPSKSVLPYLPCTLCGKTSNRCDLPRPLWYRTRTIKLNLSSSTE